MSWDAVVYVLWLAGILLLFGVVVSMLVQKLYRALPCFFTYTAFVLASSLVQLLMHPSARVYRPSYAAYFYVYWTYQAVSILLGLMVIAELFDKVFETYEGLRNLGTMVFRWATLVMVVLSIASVAALPNPDVRGIVGAILVMDRTVRVLQVGLMAFLFLFASYFRLALADLVFGIALGLTLYGCSDIVLSAARLHFGHDYAAMYSLLQSLAYNCAIFIWAAYIIRRQRMPLFDRRLSADQLHRWNDALLELLHQ